MEIILLGVILIVGVMALTQSVRKHIREFNQEAIKLKALRDQAHLAITGTIENISQRITQQGQGVIHVKGVLYYTISVESVERGVYVGETITVAVGWFSNFTPPEYYPAHLRKNYKKSDRIRIFVDYNPQENYYYTPALWYTIEPLH